ncbi:MAG: transporter, partial [Pseudonocardia sp.]|nr:transporter [Pseudonocardia sp.]
VVWRVLNIPHTRRDHRIDYAGAVALTVGLVPLLIVATQGRDWGWASASSFLCYIVGAVGLVAFLAIERRMGEDALLPLRFFRNRVFALGSAAGTIVGLGMFGGIAALPLYLQIVKGATPTQAGLLTLPLVIGIMSMSVASGQAISRTGRYKIFMVVGVTLMIGALLLLSTVGADTPFWVTATYMFLFGLGLGGNMQPLILAMQNAMPVKDLGVTTSSATFFRQVGGTLGTAVFLSVLFSTVPDKIANAFQAAVGTPDFQAAVRDPAVLADPTNRSVITALQSGTPAGGTGVLQDSSFLNHLDPRLAHPFLVGFSDSMSLVFLVGAGVLVLGLLAVIFMPEVSLRTESGLEAQRTDDLEAAAALAAATPVVAVGAPPAGGPDGAAATAVTASEGGPPAGRSG